MGSDHIPLSFLTSARMFQSTLPHGERQHKARLHCLPGSFNPRSRMGSDSCRKPSPTLNAMFQPTLPHGERQRNVTLTFAESSFNPRSRMGSDCICRLRLSMSHCFNPRSHMGSDLCEREQRIIELVSIHAPTRGATGRVVYRGNNNAFQSTLPHGERRRFWCHHRARTCCFNPRSHMGSDRVGIPNLAFQGCFNPRSYMGSDPPVHLGRTRCLVSTHAPTRGATKHVHAALQVVIVSTHAPTRGATTHTILLACARLVSTHAPAWGATKATPKSGYTFEFQPTLPHGERLQSLEEIHPVDEFQPTLPHGERHP